MAVQAEIDALIVETIARLPNSREVAKQTFDALSPRDGDISRGAQDKLGRMIAEIWRDD
jgi:hypothetical protein